jgi:hypothetical protein
MNASSISFDLSILLLTILLPYWIRGLKPQPAGFHHKGCDHLAD